MENKQCESRRDLRRGSRTRGTQDRKDEEIRRKYNENVTGKSFTWDSSFKIKKVRMAITDTTSCPLLQAQL